MILYQGYLRWNSKTIDWQKTWILDSFWDGLFFFMLTAVSFLWRPRFNNTRYGYAEFFTEDEGDDNQVPLETISVSSKRRREDKKSNLTKSDKKGVRDGFEEAILSIDLPTEDKDEIDLETEQKKME